MLGRLFDNESSSWRIEKLLVSSQVLAHFDSELPLDLACDASPYGLGAVLAHKYPDGSEHPIGYTSRSLSTAERKHDAYCQSA